MTDNLFPQAGQPQDFSRRILQVLSGLGGRDPSATNPATTEAMARSRDTVTKLLQRQLGRIDSPFSGLSDVATAAETALRARKPFGATMEDLDTNRTMKAVQIANTLSNVATREQKGGIDPIRAANLVARLVNDEAQKGNREATRLLSKVNSIAQNMDPQDALHFKSNWSRAISDYSLEHGRNPDINEREMLIDDFVRRQGYRFRAPNLQISYDPFGNPRPFNPDPYQRGGAGAPAYATGGGAAIPSRAPNMPAASITAQDAPPPAGVSGDPVPVPRVQAQSQANMRALGIPPRPGAPNTMGVQTDPNAYGPTTPAQQGAQSVDRRKADVEFQAFRGLADDLSKQIEQVGAVGMGPLGAMSRFVGAMTEQMRGLIASSPEAREQLPAVVRDVAFNKTLDSFIGTGAEAASIKAGILTFAYRYSKAADPTGPVNRNELEHALNVMGEVWGSPTQVKRVMKGLVADAERKRNLILGVQPSPSASPQGGPTKLPSIGDVDYGEGGMAYQYKGGPPGDPSSWVLIK